MVVGAKKTIQSMPSRGRISVMRIQNFTVQRRHTVLRAAYGSLLVLISVVMAAINPVPLVTNWFLEIKQGSFLYHMFEAPPYELFSEVWVYNYTNVQEFLDGTDTLLKVQEIGPFKFQEIRTNENITVNRENGTMTFNPKLGLQFIREQSIADLEDVHVMVPNIALIAISTLAADRLGYIANAGVYYSMKAIGSKLFSKYSVKELFWGYKDPLVSIANTFVPGWIDFSKLGLLDRFYAQRQEKAEMEIRNPTNKYSVRLWNDSPGLAEQGYTALNTSTPCNRIQGTYEGLLITPNYPKGKDIPIFRKQACRVYPFSYAGEVAGKYGFNHYRYDMAATAFSRVSPYACNCTRNCLPEGFVDVSHCYYGFPIALSKPHFLDVDPTQLVRYEGMIPDPAKDASFLEIEPTIGVPISLKSNIQVNIAVRTSSGNPITKPLQDMVVPLAWLSMYCNGPPENILSLLKLRFVIAPPIVITLEVVMFIAGVVLTGQGIHRIVKPKYKVIESDPPAPIVRKKSIERKRSMERKKSFERRKSSGLLGVVVGADNLNFKADDDLAKEAVSLLAISEDDDFSDILISD